MQETQHQAHISSAPKVRGKPFTKGDPRRNEAGKPKGRQNTLTISMREAVEIAARDCHPQGLAGWLIDRAQGGIQDRQIFANMVGRVIPIQVNQSVNGGISISLNWLAGRNIGTKTAQAEIVDAQVVDAIEHSPPSHWTNNAAEAAEAIEARKSRVMSEGLPSPSLPDSSEPEGR